jgi:hypothetical protein
MLRIDKGVEKCRKLHINSAETKKISLFHVSLFFFVFIYFLSPGSQNCLVLLPYQRHGGAGRLHESK